MDEPDIDFTPLIDVTFLLLIFFMVTTTLAQPTDVRLPRAKTGKGETAEDKVLVHILQGDDDAKMLRLGSDEGLSFPFDRLKQEIAAFPDLSMAMIRADEDVSFVYVDQVASKLRELGVPKVVLGVKEREFIKKK